MISYETARRMAIKFFRDNGCENIVRQLEADGCTDEVFESLVRGQGKKEVERLYFKLPKQLKIFLFVELSGSIRRSLELEVELYNVYVKFGQPGSDQRPEKLKDFPQFMRESEAILLRYLRRR